ncbi:glycerophosphodiester phosphodiesterase family protein [Streptomyces sp. NPDC057496]|uniref:glycerophosphodiester phosphodiesterase family protein n=1 Tax=Streptomyces sp. NPDC057496 TaxID=3346149 RepID=UPI0036958400
MICGKQTCPPPSTTCPEPFARPTAAARARPRRNSLEALRSSAPWADVLDLDTQVLADGTSVLMHDASVDRTTDRSGPVAASGLAQWLRLRADPATWFAAAPPALTVPTVAQVLDELGGVRVMTVEAKDPAGVQAPAGLILDRGLQDSVLVNTNDPAVVPLIRTAGCRAHLWRSAAQMAGDDFGAFVAAGADVLDIDIAASDSLVTAAVAAAPPLGGRAHTLTRRVQRDRALGRRGIVTATQITVSVPEAGVSTTVTDKAYRVPWSVSVGRNHDASASGPINIVGISTP